MRANHSGVPAKEKKRTSRLWSLLWQLKHKNNYALYTKLNTEKVMFGGLTVACKKKKKAYFLEVVVDSHRTSRLLSADISYCATS